MNHRGLQVQHNVATISNSDSYPQLEWKRLPELVSLHSCKYVADNGIIKPWMLIIGPSAVCPGGNHGNYLTFEKEAKSLKDELAKPQMQNSWGAVQLRCTESMDR